jgi:hypothetical protein
MRMHALHAGDRFMSEAVETPATETTEAPAEAAPADVKPVEAQGGQGANEDRQKDDSKLNALQRFAKEARERREARLSAKNDAIVGSDIKPEKPEPADAKDAKPDAKAKAEPAAKDAPERDEHGRFLPADGKPKADAKSEPEKPAKAGGEPKEAPAEKPEPKPSAAVEEAKDKLEAAGVEPPKQKAEETNKQYELRISKLLLEKKQRDAELLETKQRLEPRAKRAEELEARDARLKSAEIDEADFEAATGRTFEQFVKSLAKSEIKYKAKPQLAPEVSAELAEIRALNAEIRALKAELQADKQRILDERRAADEAKARAESEAHQKQAHESDAATCKTWLDEHAEKYPYLASLDDAHLQLRDCIYATARKSGGAYDPDEVAEAIETALQKRLGTIATSERAIMALLRDPKTRDLVSKQLGTVTQNATDKQPPTRNQGDQTAAAAKGPPTLTNKVTQEVPAPADRELTPEEERLAYHARMRAANKAREAALKSRLNPGS